MRVIIGFSRNDKKIGSKLIAWWMGSEFSHCYVRWYLKSQEQFIVYHAAQGMVHFKSFENFKRENTVVDEISLELTDEQFRNFSSKCIDLAGVKYSYIELIQIFLSNISNDYFHFEDQPGYICSELIGDLLLDLDISLPKPKHLLTPVDIRRCLQFQLNIL